MASAKLRDQVLSALGQASKELIKMESNSYYCQSKSCVALDTYDELYAEQFNTDDLSENEFLDLIPVNCYFH